MINVPKRLRRKVYKQLLEEAISTRAIYLCWRIRSIFPFCKICRYPELWNNRALSRACIMPFITNQDRIEYLRQALKQLE